MRVYFAADHGGFEIKNQLLAFVRDELKHEVEDCGATTYDANDDYPMIIASAALKLSADSLAGRDNRAIIAGASGQGEAMVANRFKGVRCAVYYGNALRLGLRFLSLEEAKEAVKHWLALPHTGEERHARRIKQIDEVN